MKLKYRLTLLRVVMIISVAAVIYTLYLGRYFFTIINGMIAFLIIRRYRLIKGD